MLSMPTLLIITALLGLIIGSFLNVVIYRLPIMMRQSWRQQCLEFLEHPKEKNPQQFNLFLPRSHCRNCKKPVPLWANIPFFSFIFLRGKCAKCKADISWRYPMVELL